MAFVSGLQANDARSVSPRNPSLAVFPSDSLFAGARSEASVVMEDPLTRVNRYLLENRSVCLAARGRGILCSGTGTSRDGCHALHCALEPVSSYCTLVFAFSCGDMMDLASSLWEIIWAASTAIFRHEYFIII